MALRIFSVAPTLFRWVPPTAAGYSPHDFNFFHSFTDAHPFGTALLETNHGTDGTTFVVAGWRGRRNGIENLGDNLFAAAGDQTAIFKFMTTRFVMEYIHKHYSRKLTRGELSKVFGYTPQHLNRMFKKELGYSIYQYILKIQLEHAADMLGNDELTVEQMAYEVGME